MRTPLTVDVMPGLPGVAASRAPPRYMQRVRTNLGNLNMNNRKSIVIGTSLGLLLVVMATATWLRARQAHPAASARADVAALDAAAQAQHPDTVVQDASLRSLPPAPTPRQANPAELEFDMAKMQRQARADQERLERIWNAQHPDATSAAKEQALQEAAASRIVGEARFQPDAYQVACRASMCRVSAQFARGQSSGEWVTRMLLMSGSTFGNSTTVTVPGSNGKDETTLYAFLPGANPRG